MTYVERGLEAELRALIQAPAGAREVLLLEGARQVGKTTLAEHVLKGCRLPVIAINLERDALLRSRIDETAEFSQFEDLLRDELDFDARREAVLFIDEAQESLKLGGYVRFMKESWPGIRVLLTGSTLTRLFKEDQRYPVGRVKRIVVRPFSFSEFLAAAGKRSLVEGILGDPAAIDDARHARYLEWLDGYLDVGGLPDVVLTHKAGGDFRRRRAEIAADYEQDFLRLFGAERLSIVKSCFRSVASFVGAPSKNSSVVPAPTARVNDDINRVFARLEEWRLVLRSDQRGPSPEASHRYLPKRYLFDTGVLRHFREQALPGSRIQAPASPLQRVPFGGIVENQAAIEIADLFGELSGWKKAPSGQEIDFMVKSEDRLIPVECKATTAIKGTHLRGLYAYLKNYGVRQAAVISFAPYRRFKAADGLCIVNIPLYLIERAGDLLGIQT